MALVLDAQGKTLISSAQPQPKREWLRDRCSLTRDKRGRAIVAAGLAPRKPTILQVLGDGFCCECARAPVLRNRPGRMRGTDGSRSRRIEGQAPRAGGSSARLYTK